MNQIEKKEKEPNRLASEMRLRARIEIELNIYNKMMKKRAHRTKQQLGNWFEYMYINLGRNEKIVFFFCCSFHLMLLKQMNIAPIFFLV